MNIVVGSAFRNCATHVRGYMEQVKALADCLGPSHTVRVIAAEGDSNDGTPLAIDRLSTHFGVPTERIDVSHGLPWFGSTESSVRLTTMSKIGNWTFDAVREDDDVLVYVESDLIWDAEIIASLMDVVWPPADSVLKGTPSATFDVVAPLVMAGELFYDVWAFRKNGRRFSPFPPYHDGLAPTGITSVDSAGSCLVMHGVVARAVRIPDGNALVGWCDEARRQGYTIGVWPEKKIRHPA